VVEHRAGDPELVHIGGALLVRQTLLRLCVNGDPVAAAQDGPLVLVGADEFTLHEAEALLAALTQLVDEGHRSLAAQQPQGALPVLDP
jgi:hypothetical protein